MPARKTDSPKRLIDRVRRVHLALLRNRRIEIDLVEKLYVGAWEANEANWSFQQIADAAGGVPRSTVQKWVENGRRIAEQKTSHDDG